MGMEMSMGMGVRDGGDVMTKVWALLILARKLCFDFVSLAPSLSVLCCAVRDKQFVALSPSPSSSLRRLLRFCVFRVPLLLGPRQLF
jgi:hypothetical protein